MGTRARNRMVRDRFIADQRSCGLRRHLDSVPPDTPIREIVDHCRVWESHLEQKRWSSPATDGHPEHNGVPSDPWEFTCVGKDSLRESGANVVQSDRGESQERGSSGDVGTESSVGGRAGDGVFFVWSSGTRSESMLPGEYFVSVFATGLVGYYQGWPISGGMA